MNPDTSQPRERLFTAVDLFFGREGLRAPWAMLLFHGLQLLLLYCAIPSIAKYLPWMGGTISFTRPSGLITYECAAFLSVAAATFAMAKIERRAITSFGLGGPGRLRNLLAGLASGVAMLTLLVLSLRAAGLLVFERRLLFGAPVLGYGAVWLAGFLLVGLFEETLFRGYLQFTLARGMSALYGSLRAIRSGSADLLAPVPITPRQQAAGFWSAAILLSCYFQADHIANPGESAMGLVSVFLIGLVLCFSLWRTGSLWWAIGFHAAWDWGQSYLFGVADSGGTAQARLFATHPAGAAILSGGSTGPEGSIFVLPIAVLAAACVLLTRPQSRAASLGDNPPKARQPDPSF